jgi:hypothetical protein
LQPRCKHRVFSPVLAHSRRMKAIDERKAREWRPNLVSGDPTCAASRRLHNHSHRLDLTAGVGERVDMFILTNA